MAFVIKEAVKSNGLKPGSLISKGQGMGVYKVHEVGLLVKISKITESIVLGVPKDIFDSEKWFNVENIQDSNSVVIKRKPCQSSNIISEGFNEQSQILELEFTGGGVYQYELVPSSVYERFLKSESKGRYFYSQIKGKYKYKKMK